MTDNEHFATAHSWTTATAMLGFRPRQPSFTAGCDLRSLRIHIRDHKMRDLPMRDRTLEAHFGSFVVSQARKGAFEAQRLALHVPYGPAPQPARICGHDARVYEPGPEPPPGNIDGRSPAVVTWADEEMFYLVASGDQAAATLIQIAVSLYEKP